MRQLSVSLTLFIAILHEGKKSSGRLIVTLPPENGMNVSLPLPQRSPEHLN